MEDVSQASKFWGEKQLKFLVLVMIIQKSKKNVMTKFSLFKLGPPLSYDQGEPSFDVSRPTYKG
jgi:hypothetical protein